MYIIKSEFLINKNLIKRANVIKTLALFIKNDYASTIVDEIVRMASSFVIGGGLIFYLSYNDEQLYSLLINNRFTTVVT